MPISSRRPQSLRPLPHLPIPLTPMMPPRPGGEGWNSRVRAICADIRRTEDVTAMWRAIQPVRRLLGVRSIELSVGQERFIWTSERRMAVGTSRIDVVAEGNPVGEIVVEWKQPLKSDDERNALNLLGQAIGEALAARKAAEAAEVVPSNVIPLPRRVSSGSV